VVKKVKIVIASGKGGVGKSMLASSLAMLFAKERKIVAVDCDVDAPNLHLWLGEREGWDKTEKISTNEKPVINYSKCNGCGECVKICAFGALKIENCQLKVESFFCEGCAACEVVCPKKAIKMEAVKNAEIRLKKTKWGFPLVSAQLYPGESGSGKIVGRIKREAEDFSYDLMILDAPAGTGCPVIASINGTDFAVLITEPTPSGFADLKRVLIVVSHFKIPYGVVINKWDVNRKISGKIEKWSGEKLLGKIGYDQRIFQAIAQLRPILTTDLPVKEEVKKIYAQMIEELRKEAKN